MAHRHGFWFRLRVRVGNAFLPRCVRADIGQALVLRDFQEATQALVLSKLADDVAGEDQARKALSDMGFPRVELPQFEEGNDV